MKDFFPVFFPKMLLPIYHKVKNRKEEERRGEERQGEKKRKKKKINTVSGRKVLIERIMRADFWDFLQVLVFISHLLKRKETLQKALS